MTPRLFPGTTRRTGPIEIDWEAIIRDTRRTEKLGARRVRHGRLANGDQKRYRSDGLLKGIPWFHLDFQRQTRGLSTRRPVKPIVFTAEQIAEAKAWRAKRRAA